MANPITRWLRAFVAAGDDAEDGQALEERLASLERDVERAVAGYRGTPLNQAGDLCFKAGDPDRALRYYGRAIDAFLEDGQLEPARGVGQKIVRLHPGAVRTLCTLTWLDLASGHTADAVTHLGEYVESVLRGGQESLARAQIRKMAVAVIDSEIRAAVADALERLGEPEGAAEVREWMAGGSEHGGADTPEEVRARCFEAAVRTGRP